MTRTPINVLFLCTHNAARSILAEGLLNHLGRDRFRAYSAGSSPRDQERPHPMALQVLHNAGISTVGLRSKTWDEFAHSSAPHMDLIITVCDDVAAEVCPVWPGHPATAHWSHPDPALVTGSEAHQLEAFRLALHALKRRLELLCSLPSERLQQAMLQDSARAIATN